VCGLCNRAVTFVLRRDRRAVFAFAPLQSTVGRTILERFGRPADSLDTFLVIADYQSSAARLFAKSDASLFVTRALGGWWRGLAPLRLLPVRLRDVVYDWIASRRYRWFGRLDQCELPSDHTRGRFIDS
jgi:predicted DCC family thiol-disulfide oxidoreductase YuxK